MKEENKKTNFFPKMADVHRGSNYMTRTRVNGFWLIEDGEIKEVSNSFQSLLSNLGN